MRSELRILDANANRAREAMRVIEDAARFLLDDAKLSADAKRLRHDFAAALRALGPGAAELHRDTPGDVGTAISADTERKRGSAAEVAIAAGKRLSESLRCCEEYGKVVHGAFAAAVEAMRYRGYELERRLHERLGAIGARQWRLCVIVTEALCDRHDWFDVARAAMDAGADCVQLREKSLADGQLLERAARLVEHRDELASRPRPAHRSRNKPPAVIVNERPDVALLAGADGVHLGAGDLPPAAVRKLAGHRLILGASTHNLAEARRATAAGADYCGVGAIFPTTTKRRRPSGLAYLGRFLERFPNTPHLAIGGITPDNIAEVVAVGARGVAVSSAVCGAKRPATAVRKLLHALKSDQPA